MTGGSGVEIARSPGYSSVIVSWQIKVKGGMNNESNGVPRQPAQTES